MEDLKIFNVKWSSKSAGPSLDHNLRTEIFLAGCQKAEKGAPCHGCFNSELWKENSAWVKQSPREAFNTIRKFAPNKYITFVGGEPLDQMEPLAELCRYLHRDGYHIIVITHYLGEQLMMMVRLGDKIHKKLMTNIDGLVDGEYMERYRIWDEERAGDCVHDVIGSGNQGIWDLKYYRETGELNPVPAEQIVQWGMDRNKNFTFLMKDERAKEFGFSDGFDLDEDKEAAESGEND